MSDDAPAPRPEYAPAFSADAAAIMIQPQQPQQQQVDINEFRQHQLSLSCLSKFFLSAVAGLTCLSLLTSIELFIALLLLWIPSGFLLRYYMHHVRDFIDLDLIIRTFASSFTLGALACMLLELGLTVIFAVLLLDESDANLIDPTQPQEKVSKSIGYYIFLFLTAFIVAGMVEEGNKFFWLKRMHKQRPQWPHFPKQVFFIIGMAAALGFSTIENYMYVAGGCLEASLGECMLSVAGRLFLSTPLHVGTGLLLGIGFARRIVLQEERAWWQIIAMPILFHGLFDYLLFMYMALSAGWSNSDTIGALFIQLGICAIILIAMYLYIFKYELKRFQPAMAYAAVELAHPSPV